MATVELTKDTFEQTIVDNGTVLVDFWAEWCGPCKSFAPVYEKVSEQYPDAVFAKVDTEAEPELSQYFQIRSIPTLMIFRDQIGIFSQPGALPEQALTGLIDQAMELDMDDVRRQIDEHEDHDHEGHDHEGHDHEGHDHEGHDHKAHDHA
ncbi:MAG TPA: thioredoxin [Acidimicrobiia bacterium]|nr:thioredoxin [Acidimicrobiia bacterium]